MDTFGRPPRQVLCECERTTQPNIAQAMHLLNGDFLNKKIADKTRPRREAAGGQDAAAEGGRGAVPGDAGRARRRPTKLKKAEGWVKSAPTRARGVAGFALGAAEQPGVLVQPVKETGFTTGIDKDTTKEKADCRD